MKTQTIEVTITPNDVKNSKYGNIYDCSFARAIKRNDLLRPYFETVGGVSVDFEFPKTGYWSVFFGCHSFGDHHDSRAKLLSSPMGLPSGETTNDISEMIEMNYKLDHPIEIKISFEVPFNI